MLMVRNPSHITNGQNSDTFQPNRTVQDLFLAIVSTGDICLAMLIPRCASMIPLFLPLAVRKYQSPASATMKIRRGFHVKDPETEQIMLPVNPANRWHCRSSKHKPNREKNDWKAKSRLTADMEYLYDSSSRYELDALIIRIIQSASTVLSFAVDLCSRSPRATYQ